MDFARTITKAVPRQRVIVTVHEMKRLGRGTAEPPAVTELLAIAEDVCHHDIQTDHRFTLKGIFNSEQ
ncbi:hypothetical protein AB0469_39090 [Streptomyces sp. NPDC093801]|uniref:hypothetical protein n=1 Tax=Streptomyces sp. NPDC093801 TaxID=3155203 RepID=UPI00344DA3A5